MLRPHFNIMKTLVGINVLHDVSYMTYANHCQFWYRLGREFDKEKDKFILYTPPRAGIDRMRNESARVALANECDYLLFIDDDVLVPPNCLRQLIDADKDIVAGVTHVRGYPYNPMIFKDIPGGNLTFYTDYKDHVDVNGLVKCSAVGFSLCLVKCSLIKKLIPPYFVTGTHNTEDIYFCIKAQEELGKDNVSIAAHAGVKTGHILGLDVVTPDNIQLLREYDEKENPSLVKPTDRGIDYFYKCIASVTKEDLVGKCLS